MVYVSSARKHLWKAWNITTVDIRDGLPDSFTIEMGSSDGSLAQ